MSLWSTVGHLVDADILPAPKVVASNGKSLTVRVEAKDDVDRWARHIGMPPATRIVPGQYGSIDFLPEPGWCGFPTLHVYCETPFLMPDGTRP